MIESVQYEIEWSQAARKIAHRAWEIAQAAHVTLTDLHWHRGHEVADSDNFWLTLETGRRAATAHFPNEWLDAFNKSDDDYRISRRLSDMLLTLAPPPEAPTTRALSL